MMNYNNPYQGVYQPMYSPYPQNIPDQITSMRQPYQPQPQPMINNPQPVQQDAGMIWVQGEAGAKAYMVAAGNTVVLWDSEAEVIYIKSADMSGMPSMRVFDYNERDSTPRNVSQMNTERFVTRDEFNQFIARFEQTSKPKGLMEEKNAESAL